MKNYPQKFSALEKAVLKTLVYADIFDYPLTLPEIEKYLITNTSTPKIKISLALESLLLKKILEFKSPFYFFTSRESLSIIRQKREEESRKKMKIVSSVCTSLSFIPSILFIGVSGGLAMKNVDREDDIDLFIIVEENRMWLTRFAVLLILQSLGRRRGRREKNARDKICVNMFMDEKYLTLSKDDQDIYGAHEVSQMIPVVNKNQTYEKFLSANAWVKNYLPNWLEIDDKKFRDEKSEQQRNENLVLDFLESLAKKFQVWYMQRHRTREIISDTLLAFHPVDNRKKILTEFEKRPEKYTIKL